MTTVSIIGGGFSGLTTAYYARKLGLEVSLYERSRRMGGLLGTTITPFGLIESAANAMLGNREIEAMLADIGVKLAPQKSERKRRYIFWRQPSRWPVGPLTTLRLVSSFLRLKVGALRPRPGESIASWGQRFGGEDFVERLLAPALQGIYAGDASQLSASLILAPGPRMTPGLQRGSVAPEKGMGQLISGLEQWLEANGVRFKITDQPPKDGPRVICTSAWDAAELVDEPTLRGQLKSCESLPLVSVTAFFEPRSSDLKGFGCLFPKSQGFHALGVLFNDCIFKDRSRVRSETWIFGGALASDVTELSDGELERRLLIDRSRLMDGRLLSSQVTRWPKAIPHYTVQWEQTLREMKVEAPLFLHGNYLGQLGLAKIHARSKQIAQKLKELYG